MIRTNRLHIVLTGGTGFIGTQLQKFLVSSGHKVTVYTRERSSNKSRVLSSSVIVEGSLTDVNKITTLVSQCDLVLYCAGSVRGTQHEDFSQANVLGVKVFGEAAAEMGARFLLISSLAAERPYLSDYANTKYLGEKVLEGIGKLRWCVIRPPAVYGPGDTELRPLFTLMSKGIALITGPKNQKLSLIYVDDLARAVCRLVVSSVAFDRMILPLHDAKDGGYFWRDIVESVRPGMLSVKIRVPRFILDLCAKANVWRASTFGYVPMLTPGKVRELSENAWVCDNTKINEICNWTPSVGLREGIQKTVVK